MKISGNFAKNSYTPISLSSVVLQWGTQISRRYHSTIAGIKPFLTDKQLGVVKARSINFCLQLLMRNFTKIFLIFRYEINQVSQIRGFLFIEKQGI